MIRQAIEADIPRLIEMGRAFFDASGYGELLDYDPVSVERTLRFLIGSPAGVVLVAEQDQALVGMTAGMVNPLYFNGAHITGQELFWWVEPEHRGGVGGPLFDALEAWAKTAGAETWVFVALDRLRPEIVGRFYESRGYRASDHHYIKRL